MDSKVSVCNYNLFYNDFHALKNIDFKLYSNKITAIIGKPDSGKSSLLRAINRMNEEVEGCRHSGDILLNQESIYKCMNVFQLRKNVAMIYRESNLFPQSIYNNVAFGAKIDGIKHKSDLNDIVETAIRKASLWNNVKDKIHKSALTLTLGEQQQLCIARALVSNPQIILLDESTALLDSVSKDRINELLIKLKSQHTILMSTNNMVEAVRITDNTMYMEAGEVVEYNDTETLFRIPSDKRTEDYITRRF